MSWRLFRRMNLIASCCGVLIAHFMGDCLPAADRSAVPLEATTFRPPEEVHAVQEAWARHLDCKVVRSNSIGIDLVLIPPGSYQMGSPPEEKERHSDEQPRAMTISRPFYVGRTEVTQGQWSSIMATQPWKGKEWAQEGDNFPASYISWQDARLFCSRLSRKESLKYRLLTEAEWEYACRAGTLTRYSFGDADAQLLDHAWYHENTIHVDEKYVHEVGLKRPNPFGLNDMHGNVWEWCQDCYDSKLPDSEGARITLVVDPSRVCRGGSWGYRASMCRSAQRNSFPASIRHCGIGFRIAQVP